MINVTNLSKIFRTEEIETTALNGVSFEIKDGEFVAVMGPSGCGKSTLLNILGLLDNPSEGSYLFGETEVGKLKEKERTRFRKGNIGFIFQSFNLLEQRNSLDNICFPMELAGLPRAKAVERAKALLATVGLPDKAAAYPVQLSGGQKQRIAIARALASDPEVLLCDEATSALDPQTTRDVLRLLKDINERTGITVIIITHDMSVIEEICGRVAILNHGQVAEIGEVEAVFSNPRTDAGRRLVYPDGLPVLQQGSRVIRIAFNGGTAYQPLIASVAIDCGVKLNILGADTREIDGKAFGTMLLGLPESASEAAKALAYLKSQKNITLEEVTVNHD